MKPLRFYWIRHAPPVNPGNICYGADMDVDLSDSAALERLAAIIPDGAEWRASPMSRGWKTANAIIDRHADRANIHLLIEPDVREQSFGNWVGLPRADLSHQPGFDAYMVDPENNAPPNGESLKNVAMRAGSVIDRIVMDSHKQGGDNCIVSHKGINRIAMHHTLGIPLKDTLKIASDPLSVTILEYDYRQWKLVHSNLKP